MLSWLPSFSSMTVTPTPETTPLLSANADPQVQLQERVQFLQNGFFQPTTGSTVNTINSNIGTTLTAEQCIVGQFLRRTGTLGAPVNDTTPTAADLIAFLKKYVNPVIVSQGFAWSIAYYNETSQDITLLPGTGVTIGTSIVLSTSKVSTLRVYVLNASEGSEAVYVSLLGN